MDAIASKVPTSPGLFLASDDIEALKRDIDTVIRDLFYFNKSIFVDDVHWHPSKEAAFAVVGKLVPATDTPKPDTEYTVTLQRAPSCFPVGSTLVRRSCASCSALSASMCEIMRQDRAGNTVAGFQFTIPEIGPDRQVTEEDLTGVEADLRAMHLIDG